jgi:membrane dipeptidase
MRIVLLALLSALALEAQISEKAREIHARALVFDAHIHAVGREFYHGGDISVRKTNGQFDLPRAREGGLGALFFSVYVDEAYYPARFETKQALRLIDCALNQIQKNHNELELALNATDVERIHR